MKKRTLIIDDDEDLCDEISEILRDKGFLVDTAFDGLEGRRFIEENHYNIILLDIKIPSVSGLEILRELKEKGNRCKVIIISASPTINKLLGDPIDVPDDEAEAILELADDIMRKPYDVDQLLGKIEKLIR
jgi:DNA-binding response OmpR family regulator